MGTHGSPADGTLRKALSRSRMATTKTSSPVHAEMPRRSRRGVVVAVAVVVVVVLVILGGFVIWDRTARRAGPANPGTNCPQVVKARSRPPLAAIGVHRVALIGDSIMWQASCAIANSLAGVGIETSRRAYPGTGLLTGNDWVAETRRILAVDKPDIVLAIFVGNYFGPPAHTVSGAPIAFDSPEFFAAWQARATELSAEVRAAHARLYWVSPPPVTLPSSAAARLFDGYRRIPGDHTLDSGRILAGPGNRYITSKDSCGHPVRLRSVYDGVHLSDDGARIYGQQIAHDLSLQLGILATPRPC